MANINIKIALSKIDGAKVMDIQGKTRSRKCIVIPIDNEIGTVTDAYISRDSARIDGQTTWKQSKEVYLNLVGIEFREKRYGQSHGIKAAISRGVMNRMSEEEVKSTPLIGNVKPWNSDSEEDMPAEYTQKEDW